MNPPVVPDPQAAWIPILLDIWRIGQERSMVGPGHPRLHLDRATRLAATIQPAPARALDLGSGAGIPGLALCGLWPNSRWVLLDAANRRVELLRQAIETLGWTDRVTVVHGRAEELGRSVDHRAAYDLVTARSFGPPPVTAECGGAFVRVGGLLVVTEPPMPDPARWPAAALAALGLEVLGPRAGAQHLRRITPIPDRFPRRTGVPSKRPLF